MRVTFVLPGFVGKPTGGARVVYHYADGLAVRGHQVTIVHGALLEPWQYLRPLRWRREWRSLARGILDLLLVRPAGPRWHDLHPEVSCRYARTLAARHLPESDVVVATAWRTAESVARYPMTKGAKAYLIQHYETWDGPVDRVDATWRAPLSKVVIAKWLLDVGVRLEADDVIRIPNGIDHDTFCLLTPIADRPPRVAMLYFPSAVKGDAVGVAALQRAKTQFPALQAVLFGVRPRPAHLPRWIEYQHNPPQSVLVGDIYNGSALYLCPSVSEGWHLPPAEAMACGCALVSTDIGGVADYAYPEETAVLAPVGDVEKLAAHVVALCRDPNRRMALANTGHDLIKTFTWGRSLAAFERHLVNLVIRQSKTNESSP